MAEPDATTTPPPKNGPDGQAGGAYVYVIAFVAAAGGFNFGFDIVLMSGAILYLKEYYALKLAWEEGFTMTSAIYGALVGLLIGARLADWLGRKRTLIASAVLLLLGGVGTAV